MRLFVLKDGTSNKFWNIELNGAEFTVTFGRIDTNGQTQTKSFASATEAKKAHDKLVAEKLKKGYFETTNAPALAPILPPPKPTEQPISTERKALEAALLEHPDEVAAHSAYADLLVEEGDPRGEFIQVQLALEDPSRTKPEREALAKREAELLKEYAAEWMGDVGRYLVGDWSGDDKPYGYRFSRGWLDTVRTLPVPEGLVTALARSPQARMLRQLEIVYDMRYHPFEFDQFIRKLNEVLTEDERLDEHSFYMSDPCGSLAPLVESPYLTNLHVLRYGFSDDHKGGPSHSTMVDPFGGTTAGEVLDLLKKCPRLDELYLNVDLADVDSLFGSSLLGNLRVFQHYYGTGYVSYSERQLDSNPLRVLAANKSLEHVHTLRFHPGRDAAIRLDEFDALLRSPNLPALRNLQLRVTTFGDDGVDSIVASGVLKRLKSLDIAFGEMTDAGANALAACPNLKNLAVLNVSHNALTPAGVSALAKAGVAVSADDQHAVGDYYSNYSVDWE